MKETTLRNALRSSCTIACSFLTGITVLFSFISNETSLQVQNMTAVLSGCILGGINGSSAAGLFIMAGILGIPVFPGFESGFAAFTSENGGWLWGFFTGALVSGLIIKHPAPYEKAVPGTFIKAAAASAAGLAASYIPGLLWYLHSSGDSACDILKSHILYLNIQVAKTAVCTVLTVFLRPPAARLMYPGLESALKEQNELMEKLKTYNQKKHRRSEK
ncbi:biotin transporter BioY [Treponema sp.]|jgi:biotin transport system substrate-specific component|uniref:biotin transporter BioY n=1 Tax=Treponema sp. TaxID=166 RepID=UPI00257FBECA|nr:biotin transporter BioY [Treponema sp.]MBE6354142.1 biotin transporter BioY [Treponema sp.]